MPSAANSIQSLPASAVASLSDLGANLKTARLRRKASLREWASRMEVSVPTLMKMEAGDAKVAIGVYATALFLVGMHRDLSAMAAPERDSAALSAEINAARARGVRSSINVRGVSTARKQHGPEAS